MCSKCSHLGGFRSIANNLELRGFGGFWGYSLESGHNHGLGHHVFVLFFDGIDHFLRWENSHRNDHLLVFFVAHV